MSPGQLPDSIEERCALASAPETSPEVLEQLLGDRKPEVRAAAAEALRSRQLILPVVQQLAEDRSKQVRGVLYQFLFQVGGENGVALPAGLTETLAGSQDSYLRAMAAFNLGTPAAVLANLARDPHTDVRTYVGLNPNLPTEALEDLADDPVGDVRAYVACHPNASPAARERAEAPRPRRPAPRPAKTAKNATRAGRRR
jgi:hypothetical protein